MLPDTEKLDALGDPNGLAKLFICMNRLVEMTLSGDVRVQHDLFNFLVC